MPADITPPIDGTPPATPPVTPPVDGTPPADDVGGLPSGQPNPELIGGKWADTDAMLSHIKELEDKNADNGRIASDKAKADAAANASANENMTKLQEQNQVLNDMVPEFMDNGMVVTPEMEAEAVEAGIDIRDLKINAMEFKERLGVAFNVTGGRENYEAMIEWGKTNLNTAQQSALEQSAKQGMSELAIEGLWARYEKAKEADTSIPRISGQPSPTGLQPYADRKDLYKDKDYIESNAGRRDQAAIKMYRARLKITPNEVLGI